MPGCSPSLPIAGAVQRGPPHLSPPPTPQTKYIKSDLKLSKDDLYIGNITSVAGTIFSRLVMGTVCDVMGARKGLAFCLFLTCPFIIGIMFVSDAGGFIVCRLFIGCGLASFVACQASPTTHHQPPTTHRPTPTTHHRPGPRQPAPPGVPLPAGVVHAAVL